MKFPFFCVIFLRVKSFRMQILTHEKEGDERMTRKRFYLAFLLILGLLVFASCANYDGVPNTNPNNGVLDNNNGVRNNGNGINGTGIDRNGADNGWNNNTTNNRLNNNNNLNQ